MSDDLVSLVIDGDKCIGSGMCEMLEEATFLIDENTNVAQVVGEGRLPQERAAIVIDRCPASAISIIGQPR